MPEKSLLEGLHLHRREMHRARCDLIGRFAAQSFTRFGDDYQDRDGVALGCNVDPETEREINDRVEEAIIEGKLVSD